MKIFIVVFLLLASCFGQSLPDAPKAKDVVVSNAVMWGSSVFGAWSTKKGSHYCLLEDTKFGVGNLYGTSGQYGLKVGYSDYYKRAVGPLVIITALSVIFHKTRHHDLAVGLPMMGAGYQMGIGTVEQAAGCF